MNHPDEIREVCKTRLNTLQIAHNTSTAKVLFTITSNMDSRILVYLYDVVNRTIGWKCYDSKTMDIQSLTNTGTLCDVSSLNEKEFSLNVLPDRRFTVNATDLRHVYARAYITRCNGNTPEVCALVGIHRLDADTFAIVGRTAQNQLVIESYTVTAGQVAMAIGKHLIGQ